MKLLHFSNIVHAEIFLVKLTNLWQHLGYSSSFNFKLLRNENRVDTSL